MIDVVVELGTEGPIRPGIVYGVFYSRFTNNGASQEPYFSTSPQNIAPTLRLDPGFPTTIQLGSPLIVSAGIFSSGSARWAEEAAGGVSQSSLSLFFYEADGVTPVAIADVPEPGIGGLLLVGCGVLGFVGLRKSR